MEPFVGMVVRTDGPQITVRDTQGIDWRCVLRGRLRREAGGATSPTAVGDRVVVRSVAASEGVLERVLPRRTQLVRRAAGQPRREQVLAANLDRVVIVMAAPPRPTVIDRYLAIARRRGCDPAVCVNKIDLVDRAEGGPVVEPYRDAGVHVPVDQRAHL